ncbi:MAG: hypothetical protein KIT25_05895 [Enhydrobacter sp.]|nr:MAG: hypothetical protein KIT25_05895 [Enhydrobacter sp.]
MSALGRRAVVAGGVAGIAMAVPPLPAEAREKSGTVHIEQVQVAFIGSGNVGSGTLHFQGKTHRFTVGGLGVGGFGISRMEATGEIYDLKELRQFPGVYVQARKGMALGDKGSGEMWLENANGVQMTLRTRRVGLALSLGGDGVVIDFR